ncbi:hypothetical protein BCON_0001g01140 [Botryotinia convoluta]|uniref:Uncharacterized protein n=1 Tax=Botryotinia convoluta TaxID=54673 RepID=A0A4Z1IWP5_9HELO|nr:hypothetical protein BCON_0001g01140 [Botryotinia convoluta]
MDKDKAEDLTGGFQGGSLAWLVVWGYEKECNEVRADYIYANHEPPECQSETSTIVERKYQSQEKLNVEDAREVTNIEISMPLFKFDRHLVASELGLYNSPIASGNSVPRIP